MAAKAATTPAIDVRNADFDSETDPEQQHT